jgi:hypothetical protein
MDFGRRLRRGWSSKSACNCLKTTLQHSHNKQQPSICIVEKGADVSTSSRQRFLEPKAWELFPTIKNSKPNCWTQTSSDAFYFCPKQSIPRSEYFTLHRHTTTGIMSFRWSSFLKVAFRNKRKVFGIEPVLRWPMTLCTMHKTNAVKGITTQDMGDREASVIKKSKG